MVEYGPVSRIFNAPAHPYTEALLNSIPRMGDSRKRLTAIEGQPPDLSRAAARLRLCPALPGGVRSLPQGGAAGVQPGRRPNRALLAGKCQRAEGCCVMPVLEAAGLSKHFQARRGIFGGSRGVVRAVDDISFAIESGRTLGVVGESGCGKTTTAKLVLGLEEPTGGSIRFEGRDLHDLDTAGRRHYRKSVQAVFQDPYASLSPRMRISDIIAEPLVTNEVVSASGVRKRVLELLDLVGLAERSADLFPHEFSGGQRQRIAIARALALSPKLIVLDEPVSALDVSIRAQILNLLRDLQDQLGLSYLFIAHDLAAVAHMSHTIVVMYLGKIVEMGDAQTLARVTEASVHRGAVLRGAAEPSGRAARGDHPAGRGAQSAEPAVRLPLPPALPARDAGVRPGGARAGTDGRTVCRLPPVRSGAALGIDGFRCALPILRHYDHGIAHVTT